ncbi:MAG: YtoQ family protein [Candidatus Zixiibacteriota bacterium]|nr:MAG: YtoQ family protein [candidate division Zixibacteria bacterium]
MSKKWKVYLSGEIHSNWRQKIISAVGKMKLPIEFSAPVTDHTASDDCGVRILGKETEKFWHDHKGARVNAIRTQTLLEEADIVVVRFGDKYKQWNTAFEAGYAAALNIPLIVQHPKEYIHALKELDATAYAACETVAQVVKILKYVTKGKL